jgi:hypothetical protein
MHIGTWPMRRIIWLGVAWVAFVIGVLTVAAIMALRTLPPDDSGVAGIGVNLRGLAPVIPVLLIPPACLILVWAWQRKQRR